MEAKTDFDNIELIIPGRLAESHSWLVHPNQYETMIVFSEYSYDFYDYSLYYLFYLSIYSNYLNKIKRPIFILSSKFSLFKGFE
ncbi:Uncharacterised protein [Legionella pneumophila]|nr:Uncharacterised protein [Legionella pneumophila]